MKFSFSRIPEFIYRRRLSNKLRCPYLAYIQKPVYIKGEQYITVGTGFAALPGVRIEAWDNYAGENFRPRIVIGNNVTLNYRTHIGAIKEVVIGNNVLTGSDVLIEDHNHGGTKYQDELDLAPLQRPLTFKGAVIIEDNVWIGDKATVLGGVHIGKGAIIGANSVVLNDVPDYAVVVGNPAKVIRIAKKRN